MSGYGKHFLCHAAWPAACTDSSSDFLHAPAERVYRALYIHSSLVTHHAPTSDKALAWLKFLFVLIGLPSATHSSLYNLHYLPTCQTPPTPAKALILLSVHSHPTPTALGKPGVETGVHSYLPHTADLTAWGSARGEMDSCLSLFHFCTLSAKMWGIYTGEGEADLLSC